MCDTVCVLGHSATLFAKNSDRPRTEAQVAEVLPARSGGGRVRTQYLEIDDTGAEPVLVSRPTWLWGAEHGVNGHRVAIGNEMIFTRDDPGAVEPALIGMDLVRLGLERSRSAVEALEAMTGLLERHGQGGVGDAEHGLSYWSSFLVADPSSAWILETSGRTWAARPVSEAAALSNRVTLRRDWTRASADVAVGTDVDEWRHPALPTGFADTRLAAGRAFATAAAAAAELATGAGVPDPAAAVAALRDHGSGPWGRPGEASSDPPGAPEHAEADGAGWTLCLHAGDTAVTTASMVTVLPRSEAQSPRAWIALGSPCLSVYVPVPVPDTATGVDGFPLPAVVGDAKVWGRLAALRDAVGSDVGALAAARAELGAAEARLWEEAEDIWAEGEALGPDRQRWESFGARASRAVERALDAVAAAGLGGSGRRARGGR